MVGSAPLPVEPTAMVFTPVPGMAKLTASAPEVALACWMAALSVHREVRRGGGGHPAPRPPDHHRRNHPPRRKQLALLRPHRCFSAGLGSHLPLLLPAAPPWWAARFVRLSGTLGRGEKGYIVRGAYSGYLFFAEALLGAPR